MSEKTRKDILELTKRGTYPTTQTPCIKIQITTASRSSMRPLAQGTAKEPWGFSDLFFAGQILTSRGQGMRTHVVSQQLHQLHVAAFLPPQARLERLEKDLATWRLIRRRPAKASRITCQTASDHRKRRYRYAHCYRCSSPVPGARVSPRALLPPALRNQLENSN